jgi:hypothetical protein
MQKDNFYHEMSQTAAVGTDLIIEKLYKASKITCLNGIELKEGRSIKFQYVGKTGNNVYYVTDAGVRKLEKSYNVSHSLLLT